MSELPELKICTAYELDGRRITDFPSHVDDLRRRRAGVRDVARLAERRSATCVASAICRRMPENISTASASCCAGRWRSSPSAPTAGKRFGRVNQFSVPDLGSRFFVRSRKRHLIPNLKSHISNLKSLAQTPDSCPQALPFLPIFPTFRGKSAPAHRHDHGRQRPLGRATRAAASKGTAPAPPASAASPRNAPGWASNSLRSIAFPARTGNGPPRNSISSCNCCRTYLIEERPRIMEHNIRVAWIGRREGLRPEAIRELDETIRLSSANTGLCVCLAINYGGRAELVDAVRRIAEEVRPRLARSGDDRRGDDLGPALHGRHARSRFADSHGRRDAGQQLSALADQLCGDLGNGDLLAGLRRSPAPCRPAQLCRPRPAIRWFKRVKSINECRTE